MIHAGIYYPTGLDKTRLCVDGKAMLYDFCQEFNVPHQRCGKLLVAASAAEIEKLAAIKAQAEANGVTDLVWLSGAEARALEPALVAERALLSPSTGIIDSHAFMLALLGDAEGHGAMIAFEAPVIGGAVDQRGLIIDTGGASPCRIAARLVVNAAGLGAQAVARSICGMPSEMVPPLHLAKGNYFSLATRSPFSHLIYPMPTPGGLGVHLTLDLGGRARFGPDVEWIEAIDYAVDPKRAESFYAAIRTYWPDLPDGSLQARLFRHPAEDRQARRVRRGFSDPDGETSRRRRPDQPLWDRVAGPDVEPGDRRMDCATDLKGLREVRRPATSSSS